MVWRFQLVEEIAFERFPRLRGCRRATRVGFGVSDLGFEVWDLRFGVWGLGFRVWDLGFGVWGLEFRFTHHGGV